MGISSTSIANKALRHLGQDPILSLESDESVRGEAIRSAYEETLEEVLRDFDWKFAIVRKDLNADASYTGTDFSYRYILPTTPRLLRFLEVVNGNGEKYALEGSYIYSNASSMRIKYVAKISDPLQYDSTFTETFALKLAGVTGYKITGNQGLADAKLSMYEKVKLDAQVNDSQEKPQTYIEDSSWEAARGEGTLSFMGNYV